MIALKTSGSKAQLWRHLGLPVRREKRHTVRVVPWLNWIEQPPPKGQVAGSNPAGVAKTTHNSREVVIAVCWGTRCSARICRDAKKREANASTKSVQFWQVLTCLEATESGVSSRYMHRMPCAV